MEQAKKATRSQKRKVGSTASPPPTTKKQKTTPEPASEPLNDTDAQKPKEATDETKKPKLPIKTSTSSKGLSTQKAQIDKHIRQAASSVLATINPGVSLSLEEKREKLAELKKVGVAEPIKEASPEEIRFLPQIFQHSRKEWPAGLEDLLLLLNQPPTIEDEVASTDDPSKTTKVRTFGPAPKLDPDFLVPALNGYSAVKANTGQVMTKFDHHFRNWMQVKTKFMFSLPRDKNLNHLTGDQTQKSEHD